MHSLQLTVLMYSQQSCKFQDHTYILEYSLIQKTVLIEGLLYETLGDFKISTHVSPLLKSFTGNCDNHFVLLNLILRHRQIIAYKTIGKIISKSQPMQLFFQGSILDYFLHQQESTKFPDALIQCLNFYLSVCIFFYYRNINRNTIVQRSYMCIYHPSTMTYLQSISCHPYLIPTS